MQPTIAIATAIEDKNGPLVRGDSGPVTSCKLPYLLDHLIQYRHYLVNPFARLLVLTQWYLNLRREKLSGIELCSMRMGLGTSNWSGQGGSLLYIFRDNYHRNNTIPVNEPARLNVPLDVIVARLCEADISGITTWCCMSIRVSSADKTLEERNPCSSAILPTSFCICYIRE